MLEAPPSGKRIFLLTGPPGIGKTTAVVWVAELLRREGVSVGGMITREVRGGAGGARVGFEVLDLSSGNRGWLARACQGPGPRVGRYLVDIASLEGIGASGILDAVAASDVIAIDEIGPMELLSGRFREAVGRAAECGKPVVATVHFRSRDPLIESIKARVDSSIFLLDAVNRGSIPGLIAAQVLSILRGS
ncbi:MAG: NTPase [Candidatus Methanosuratincola verstraetei]